MSAFPSFDMPKPTIVGTTSSLISGATVSPSTQMMDLVSSTGQVVGSALTNTGIIFFVNSMTGCAKNTLTSLPSWLNDSHSEPNPNENNESVQLKPQLPFSTRAKEAAKNMSLIFMVIGAGIIIRRCSKSLESGVIREMIIGNSN